MTTGLRSILFFIFAPGMVAGVIPLALLRTGPKVDAGLLAFSALPLWVMGIAVLFGCFWDFLVKGRGTPAPTDPPKELVVSGAYKYVRNPMYAGVLMAVIGHFLWFGYWWILAYAVALFVIFTLFVMFYEEPHLKSVFGDAYIAYQKEVPRWLPWFRNRSTD